MPRKFETLERIESYIQGAPLTWPGSKPFGGYLPERVVPNAEMEALAGVEPGWIVKASGIEERRFAAEGETVVDLAVRAAQDCLAAAEMAPSQLGMLIVASGSRRAAVPGPAASVAHRLGLSSTPALDLPVASAGSLIRHVAGQPAGRRPRPDPGRRRRDHVAHRAAAAPQPGHRYPVWRRGRRLVSSLPTPASPASSIPASTPDGSSRKGLRLDYRQPLAMDGRTVILQAARKIPRAIEELLKRNRPAPRGEVQAFVLHQANLNLILKVAQALQVSETKFSTTVRHHGNTSFGVPAARGGRVLERRGPSARPAGGLRRVRRRLPLGRPAGPAGLKAAPYPL